MEPPIKLQKAGGQWWRTHDEHSPNLSKASLGRFMTSVLSSGAHIGSIWPFSTYPRSGVYFMVYMTHEMKARIESETEFRFTAPQTPQLN